MNMIENEGVKPRELPYLSANLNLDSELDDSQFITRVSQDQKFCAMLGTTYASNNASSEFISTMCLDAFAEVGNSSVIADGYMHYADEDANKRVFALTEYTIHSLIKHSQSYLDAKILYNELYSLFKKVKRDVKSRFHVAGVYEESSALITKVFHRNKFEIDVVTGSIGDGVAFVWTPVEAKITWLALPRHYKMHKVFDPMAVTEDWSKDMLESTITHFSNKSFIIRLSDGAWQNFPYESYLRDDKDSGCRFIEYKLDEAFLSEKLKAFDIDLKKAPSPLDYTHFLKSLIIEQANLKRINLKEVKDLLLDIIAMHDKECITVDDLYHKIVRDNPVFGEKLKIFLRDNEIPIEDLTSVRLLEFTENIRRHIHLGDDVTITISEIL